MKVSVITVCYNVVNTIEQTILSVLSQTYSNVEYIIIDGGSTDGTVDIIRKYEEHISYWVSEPDKGIYDAMNKGILAVTGQWINFMNSGDFFTTPTVIEKIFDNKDYKGVDIIYGDATILKKKGSDFWLAGTDVSKLALTPIYRHGASFVKTEVHRLFMFDLTKQKKIGYALDYDVIYRLYKAHKNFQKVDINIMSFEEEGISNHPFLNAYYVYRITSNYRFSWYHFKLMLTRIYNIAKSQAWKFFSRCKHIIYN